MQLLPVINLSRFDPECESPMRRAMASSLSDETPATKLHALQERLKAAREDSHALTIQAANIEHQLFREWDSLSLASDAARDRHNETAMGYKEWYREMRGMHKRRIQQLEMEIQQEVRFNRPISLTLHRLLADIQFYHIVRLHELARMVTSRAPHPLEIREYELLDLQRPRSHIPRPGGFQTGSWA